MSKESSGGSFADKYSKSKNNLQDLLNKKKENPMTTAQAISKDHSDDQNPSLDPSKTGKADLIYLVKGVDDNRNAWYYVLVERLKLSLFLKALNDDIIHLENYGEILYSAYGDEPSQEITDKLKKEYGIK